MSSNKNKVPKRTPDPIGYLLARGWTPTGLAHEWKLRTTDNIRKLSTFNHVPSYRTAGYMAITFGWDSAGEVMDFWAERVSAIREAAAS